MTSMRILQGEIPSSCAGMRLDQALAQLFDEYSRSRLSQWLKAGQVRVNGQQMRGRDKVWGGEQVEIHAELEEQTDWQAEAIPLEIVYEDEQLIVINKPAGLVVHPAAGNPAGRRREDAHDGTGSHCFAASALTYQPQNAALPDFETQAVHGFENAFVRIEIRLEVINFE